jgi:hypothetical protein
VSTQSIPGEYSQCPRQSTRRAGTVSSQSTGVGGARKRPGAEVDGGEPALINSVRVVVVHLLAEKVECRHGREVSANVRFVSGCVSVCVCVCVCVGVHVAHRPRLCL